MWSVKCGVVVFIIIIFNSTLHSPNSKLFSEYLLTFSPFYRIISMSIFFSVHYLVMYYLLQPYDKDSKVLSIEEENITNEIKNNDFLIFSYPVQYSTAPKILRDFISDNSELWKNKKVFVTHQTRPENVAKLQKFYAENKIHANVLSFIHDMCGAISDADLVIGRSGASTVVEIQTVGRPAIFVPLNINPDQAANAASFAKTGGGFAIEQSKFTPRWLSSTLSELFDNPSRLEKMAAKSRVENNAVNLICDEVTK